MVQGSITLTDKEGVYYQVMVTTLPKPTSVTKQPNRSWFQPEKHSLFSSTGGSHSLNGACSHEGPNIPIPTITIRSMEANIVLPFPGNWKRHTGPSSDPSDEQSSQGRVGMYFLEKEKRLYPQIYERHVCSMYMWCECGECMHVCVWCVCERGLVYGCDAVC